MAKKNPRQVGRFGFKQPYFRVSNLTEDQIQQIGQLGNLVGIPKEELFEYIERTGQLPERILQVIGRADPASYLRGLPSREEALRAYIGAPEDIGLEPILEDVELQDRLLAYQGLVGSQQTSRVYDRDRFAQIIKDEALKRINANGINGHNEAGLKIASEYAADAFEKGNYNPQVFAEYISDRSGGEIGPGEFERLKNAAKDIGSQFGGNRFNEFYRDVVSTPADYSTDIKRINDLLSARGLKRQREEELSQFESGLESEFARGREEFLRGEEEYGRNVFQNVLAPQIAENLNIRGLLYSGDLASELARSASGIQSGTEAAFLKQQEEDDLFFQNAAYNTTFRKEIEAGRDISSALSQERETQRANRQISFQRTQNDLRRRYQEESYQRDLERQSRLQEQRLRLERDVGEKQRRNELVGNIGSTLGQIGGTIIGSRIGNQAVVSPKGVVNA